MKALTATVHSVHLSAGAELPKAPQPGIEVALDGIIGDRHRSFERVAWSGDKQVAGTIRRNERQWSAVSVEELRQISSELGLGQPIDAADLGANLCLIGINALSRLPKGTLLRFPSGAELLVEEYNPPCLAMSKSIAAKYRAHDGGSLADTAFSVAAKLTRGIVGVVEVPGAIRVGDRVHIEIYEPPGWLAWLPE